MLVPALFGAGALVPLDAVADAPPSLPDEETEAEEAEEPGADGADTDGAGAPELGGAASGGASVGGSVDATPPSVEGDMGGTATGGDDELLDPGSSPTEPDPFVAPGVDDPFAETPPDDGAAGDGGDGEGAGDDDPGMVQGRREPMLSTTRGGTGLFYTSLPDVGGKYTFRFRLGSDFFVKDTFFVDSPTLGSDRHARFRGNVNIGFSFTKYTEVWFGINGSSNNNERNDPNRQDRQSLYALGDMDLGVKGAWRGVRGGAIGVGGQLGTTLLAGTSGSSIENANFFIDVLFALDVRYLTEKHVPVRVSTNIGYLLDNSWRLTDFEQVDDLNSREVLRFGLGINYPRVRTSYAVDFPVRLGKNRQFGLDPFVEYSWDISTFEAKEFRELTLQGGESPLPRSQSWLTIGLRANVWQGMFLDAGVDVGTVSPNYEYGPPVPPYQVMLGLGWSIDPKPVIKEVPVEAEVPAPAPVAVIDDGRVTGTVVAVDGTAVAGAKVTFPGITANPLLTDQAGAFMSYRFPAGPVTVQVELADGSVLEQTVEVTAGEDTVTTFTLEGPPPEAGPVSGIMDGTFTDGSGGGVEASIHVTGQGIDEPFNSDPNGRIAVELPGGDYTGTVKADGYKSKEVTFTVDGDVSISATLEKDVPEVVDTPWVSGNKNRIRLRRKIRYDGDEVSGRSSELLDQIAAFMKSHPEYASVQIQVHTDDRGSPDQRSEARAESVKSYLVSKGVDASRLDTKGYGARNPVAVNLTPDGRAKNNRTYLRVKDYTGGE